MPRLPKQLQSMKFLSTPSARRATAPQATAAHHGKISIHALREEGDVRRAEIFRDIVISIHALREEGDCFAVVAFAVLVHFYPRPPRGGRQPEFRIMSKGIGISIHALREEGDLPLPYLVSSVCVISIHALREEGDIRKPIIITSGYNFYPRPPRGGRPAFFTLSGRGPTDFYPRPP